MKRVLLALLALCSPALADYHPPIEYGVAATVDFVLYNTDGTLDVDEADGGSEVTVFCDGDAGTTATNDFTDEGSFYSIALTASETQCARVTLDIAATDRNVVIIPTFGNASAQVNYDGAGLTEAGGTGDQFTALNDLSAAQVNAEVDTAIETYHLDHLLAADYDPASKPGVGTALLNELIESDSGVSRYTVNALEQGPSGSGASAAAIADAVWDEVASGHTTAGTFGDALGVDVPAILVDTAAIPSFPTNFPDLDIEATTGHVDVGYWNGTAISTALETSADIADAVLDEDMTGHQTAGTLGAAIGDGDGGAGLDSVPWNAAWDAQVQSEADDALVANHLDHLLAVNYDPASQPGSATALLNELIENDGGVSRYTVNALEQGPSGSGASAAAIADAVWTEALGDHSGGAGSTAEALDDATTGGGLDAAGVRSAVGLASANLDTQLSTIDTNVDDIETDTSTTLPAQITALNDLSQAEAQTAAAAALTAYDPPTDTEMDSQFGDIDTLVGTPSTDLAADIAAVLAAMGISEPGSVPNFSSDAGEVLSWLLALSRNEIQQTSTTKTIRNDADTGNIATCSVSDDGTTFQRSECN